MDSVLDNDSFIDMPARWKVNNVPVDEEALARNAVKLLRADLINEDFPTRHDPHKLANALMQVIR